MGLRITRPAIDLTDRRFVEGTEESRRRAREEAAEQIRMYQQHDLAMKSQLPEIPRAQLEFGKFGRVEDGAGEFYSVIRGVVTDPAHSPAVAFYVTAAGDVAWLERPASGPQNRGQLEEQHAERERGDAEPKPRPS
jgi:hypothetical protein